MANQSELMDGADHAWLRMESEHNFMMIGVVLIFEDPLPLNTLHEVLQTRLIDRHRRFRQCVVHKHGLDYWQDDPWFNLDNHLISSGFPHDGNQRDLQTLASQLMSTPLDKDKPLWSAHHVGHYVGGSALIIRIHHCIADGMSLVRLIMSLADPVQETQNSLCNDKPTSGAGTYHHAEWLDLITHPSHLIDAGKTALGSAEELAAVTLRIADPDVGLKGKLSGIKRVAWAEPLPLPEVKALAKAGSATVNDILMATAAGVIRHHLLDQGIALKEQVLHAAVPFNLRPLDDPIDHLGNQFGLIIVPLPVAIADPLLRLQTVKREMQTLKHSVQPYVFYSLLQLLGLGPSFLEKTALDILSKKASLVMTNVPGPRQALYLAGAKLTQPMAWVPQSGDIGIGLSVLSYNDTVQFGFIADISLIESPDRIAALFIDQFRLLQKSFSDKMTRHV